MVQDHIILLNLYTKLADTHTHTKKIFCAKEYLLSKGNQLLRIHIKKTIILDMFCHQEKL